MRNRSRYFLRNSQLRNNNIDNFKRRNERYVKIVKFLEEFDLLIKCVSEETGNESNEAKGWIS